MSRRSIAEIVHRDRLAYLDAPARDERPAFNWPERPFRALAGCPCASCRGR